MRNLIGAFSIIGLLLLSGCASFLPHKALPIEGWVVDAETKQPLEGVIVRVQWDRHVNNGFHPVGFAPFLIKETVTDSDGRFYFPEWEQRIPGALDWSSPRLVFIKENYTLLIESNTLGMSRRDSPSALKSKWHGKVIPLAKSKDQKEYYGEEISFLRNDVHHIINLGCIWENMPRTLAFLIKEREKQIAFNPKIIPKFLWGMNRLKQKHLSEGCHDPETFLKEYLQ